MKLATIVLIALLVLGALLLLAIVWGAAAEGAVKAALADQTTYATSEQRSTTVCVGLLNMGCDTAQTSTTTAQRRTDDAQHNPFELLIVLALTTALLFGMALVVFLGER